MPTIEVAEDHRFWESLMRRPAEEAIPPALSGRWWVAHAKPRSEKALVLDLQARGVFSYLPLCERITRSRKSGRESRSIVPVFTGYVFFNADDEARRAALMTNRIAGTLPVENQARLSGELRQIQTLLASQSVFDFGPALAEGDWVRVTAGPLSGVEGVVVRKVNRYRIALNVNMLSQSVQVDVPRDLLEKIEPPTYARG